MWASLVIGVALGFVCRPAWAQYMSLNITAPYECGPMTVQWWGDEGPYHLLLTPTEIREHSYNVWIPSVPDGNNTYTTTLRQPEGLPFMVTVWGRSGIQFAGSSDIYTVGPPSTTSNSSCFLTDEQILERYSFSFNITGSRGGFPPQCSNMTLSWPTSLEQNVLGTLERRDWDSETETAFDLSSSIDGADAEYDPTSAYPLARYGERSLYPPSSFHDLNGALGMQRRQSSESNPSSSSDRGNTTNPPTVFGLIPLGNSFSLPITYAANSTFADSLPESSVSSQPTTFTSQGVTYLNWTLPLAKGTRFILVAGIGSAEQWASGGSSRLMTVGQGDESCLGVNQDDGPSVTADPTNTDSIPTATRPPDDGSSPNEPSSGTTSNLTRIVLACVISVVGTLVLVLALWFWRRWKRQRNAAASLPGKKGRVDPFDPNLRDSSMSADTQLDLLGRDGLRLDTRLGSGTASPGPYGTLGYNDHDLSQNGRGGGGGGGGPSTPTSPKDPFSTPIEGRHYSYPLPGGGGPSRSSTLDTLSPIGTGPGPGAGAGSIMGRQSSREALLSHGTGNVTPTLRSHATQRRLALQEGFEEEETEGSDLKRETLAAMEGGSSSQQGGSGGTGRSTPVGMGMGVGMGGGQSSRRSRRRPDEEVETEYVVHRDAGRVDRVELPPRYDQVQWEER